jgi:hypothetical protein
MLGAWRRSEQGSGGVTFLGASSFVHIVEVSPVDESGDVVEVNPVDTVEAAELLALDAQNLEELDYIFRLLQ